MCSLAGRRLHWVTFLFFVMLGRLRDHRRRSRGSKGSVAPPPPPPVEICESPTPRFGAEKTFTDVLDNTCGHRRLQNAHFLPSDGTQELPKKHHEAGPPEQLPTDALSQIDYVHTWNFKMMWTAEIQIDRWVGYCNLSKCKVNKPEIFFWGLKRDSNPWPLR